MRPKSIVTWALLVFVVVSVGVLIRKEVGTRPITAATPVGPPEGPKAKSEGPRIIAYYFHGQARCVTCRTIETYARETIDTHFADALKTGRLEIRAVNFDEPANEHFLDDYELSSPSLVLVDHRGSGTGSWKLLQEVWQLTNDKPAFVGYVKEELDKFLATHGG